MDIGKSIQEDSQSDMNKSNQQSNAQSNITDQINDTSEILNVNLMNARMHVEEINNITYETIKKKKYLNLMGKKCDYDVRSESNVYKSRPNTNYTNYRNTESKNTMNVSRSMHKLDSLHDLSNIKQYKGKNHNNNKPNLIHLGPSMSRPPSKGSYEYLKSGSPTLDNNSMSHTRNSRPNPSPTRIKIVSSTSHPNLNLKLNLNKDVLNNTALNHTNEASSDRQDRLIKPSNKNSTASPKVSNSQREKASSSERRDRVDVKPTFEVNAKFKMSRMLLRSRNELRNKNSNSSPNKVEHGTNVDKHLDDESTVKIEN